MRRSTFGYGAVLTIAAGMAWAGCTYHTPDAPIYNVTQNQLDEATILTLSGDTAIVGDPFNAFAADTFTTKHKLRDLFENISLDNTVKVGTIMARRAYYIPAVHHERDSLINIVVMIKRERGYYPEGGDWEYMDIKYDQNTDYNINPNGMLIAFSDNIIRGKIAKCANCHALAGSNFVFHRSQ